MVINADDFGALEKVNAAIDKHLKDGLINSATIIANGRAVKEAVEISKKYPQASFGIHLNISEGKPTSQQADLKPILDAEGNFLKDFRAVPLTKSLKKAIVKEWMAQIDYLRNLGVKLSHADSHHHTHTLPNLLWVVRKVTRESGIVNWRRSRTLYKLSEENKWKVFLKKQYNGLLSTYAKTKGTTHFTDVFAMKEYLEDGIPDRVEVMCHPGLSSSEPEDKLLRRIVTHPKVILKNYWQL